MALAAEADRVGQAANLIQEIQSEASRAWLKQPTKPVNQA